MITMAAIQRLKQWAKFSSKPPHKLLAANQVAPTVNLAESESDLSKHVQPGTSDESNEPDDNKNTRLQNIIRSTAILCGWLLGILFGLTTIKEQVVAQPKSLFYTANSLLCITFFSSFVFYMII